MPACYPPPNPDYPRQAVSGGSADASRYASPLAHSALDPSRTGLLDVDGDNSAHQGKKDVWEWSSVSEVGNALLTAVTSQKLTHTNKRVYHALVQMCRPPPLVTHKAQYTTHHPDLSTTLRAALRLLEVRGRVRRQGNGTHCSLAHAVG